MLQIDPITLVLTQLSTVELREVEHVLQDHAASLEKLRKNKNYTEKFNETHVLRGLEITHFMLTMITKIITRRTGA